MLRDVATPMLESGIRPKRSNRTRIADPDQLEVGTVALGVEQTKSAILT
jgi:hypothetical protein